MDVFFRDAGTRCRKMFCYFYPRTCTLISNINIVFIRCFKLFLFGRILHEVYSGKSGTSSLVAISSSDKYTDRGCCQKKSVVIAHCEEPALPAAHTETFWNRLSYINKTCFLGFSPYFCFVELLWTNWTSWYTHISCLQNPSTLMMNYIWPKQIVKKPGCL